MTTVRQDAWTKDEDLLLAEVVLRHIREGSTQLKAFEEVGRKLSRTPAACGFRWNSQVRKQYKAGIELAKKQRKELKKSSQGFYQKEEESPEVQEEQVTKKHEGLNFDIIISYLEGFKNKEQKTIQIYQEKQELESRISEMENRIKELLEENERLKKENTAIKDEYLSLLSIMEKARKLAAQEGGQLRFGEKKETEEENTKEQ